MIIVASCGHSSDDERIYYKQIQSLKSISNAIVYFTYNKSDENLSDNDFQKSLNSFSIPNGRGKIKNIDGLKIIDDAYNANPASMKFAIRRLSEANCENKKILIIGDMLELRSSKIEEHIKIWKLINKSNIDIILTFGDTIEYTLKELNDNFFYKKHFNDIELLKKKFKKIAKKNDLIYIKGSRSMQLERIYS